MELRHGASGAPIVVGQALPGHYAGDANTPIRVATDANGYYRFTGLAAGTYAVVEISPEGLIDGIDTPGTLGGVAINPVGVNTPPPIGQNGEPVIPPPTLAAILNRFQRKNALPPSLAACLTCFTTGKQPIRTWLCQS